ncbi:SPOR domain-containing protein [Marinoscillum sp. MHG1-6]|uniref:SPOR domain-containing protein n=1 Tax=Marinoscillum sp. MHG1-6 TaxID=2959627 RepID=UPI002157ADB8|nr:SPOR domain-containing protein [Marinoscillum sp. MHG1-6]
MANKKDKNEDPEEEKKNQFDDDDDFGLPDLDYDELEEEADEELDIDPEEAFSDIEEEESTEEEAPEPTADEEIEAVDEGESFEASDDIGLDEDWEKELESELEDEMKSGNFDESFYEEESFEDFGADLGESEPAEEPQADEVGGSVFGADDEETTVSGEEDDFYAGIDEPKDEFVEQETDDFTATSSYGAEEAPKKGNFTRTVVIGTLLFLIVGAVFYILYDSGNLSSKPVAKKEEPKEEPVKKEEEAAKAETEVVAGAEGGEETTSEVPPAKEEPKKEVKPESKPVSKPAATANAVAAGEITKLSSQTGKSYVVVGSFFDGDMADDFANELSGQGKSPYVIPPFKEHRFYRVAIAEFDTFGDARDNLGTYQAEFGPDVWALRY